MNASQAVYVDTPEEPAAEPRLSIRDLCLELGWRTVLDEVSFDIRAGEVFGMLGPNGCGKSSIIRCLTGLVRPTRGTFWLDGKQIELDDRALRASIGVVFQDPSLDSDLTAEENLVLGARLFAVARAEARERASSLLGFMELTDRADDPVKTFSGGMRRRLELARALIHRPRMLVLDEPTTGLDPHAFERSWKLLMALNRSQGLTVLLSTHSAEEAARCDRLVVIDRGRVVACDTPQALLARVSGDIITIACDEPRRLADELREHMQLHTQVVEGRVLIETHDAHAWIPRLVEAFPPGTFHSIAVRRPTLSDAFLKLTGRTLEEASKESAA